jgi:hypothetical protein
MNSISFLTDVRRLNVAISRAQNFMFVVGNFTFWEERITTVPTDKPLPRDRKGKVKFRMRRSDAVPKTLELARANGMVVKYVNNAPKDLPRNTVAGMLY